MTAPRQSIDDQLNELRATVPNLGAPNADAGARIPPPPPATEPVDFGKRRRGGSKRGATQPPPQQPPPQAAPQLSTQEIAEIGKALGLGFRVIFSMIAAKRGAHWNLNKTDEEVLGVTWATAAAPWLASSGKYVPLAVAGLATLGVALPRLEADNRMAAEVEAAAAAAAEANKNAGAVTTPARSVGSGT